MSEKARPGPVLRIDGHSEGPIHYSGNVSVGPQGVVTGDICAAAVFIEGDVSGNVRASETLRIAATATIVGDMYSPKVAVERGAKLRGILTMHADLIPPSDLDGPAVDTLLSGAG